MSLDFLDESEEFPFPTKISRSEFEKFDQENIDEYLFQNHRFSPVDSLISELELLSSDLNNELLQLVNGKYSDFINLGKSINGGLELINSIKMGMKSYKKELLTVRGHLEDSNNVVEDHLEAKDRLMQLRFTMDTCILIDTQINNFENLLRQEEEEQLTPQIVTFKTVTLAGCYFSMLKSYHLIHGFYPTAETNHFISKHLRARINSAQLEFKSFLDELTLKCVNDKSKYKSLFLDLMHIYKQLGSESEFLSIIKKRN